MMLATQPYTRVKKALYTAFLGLVTPDPNGPIKDVVRGHFSLYRVRAGTLYIYYAGADENPTSADELMIPGTWMFGVSAAAPKLAETFGGSGQVDAEQNAEECFGAYTEAVEANPDLGLSGVSSITLQAARASDADEFGTPYADVDSAYLWVEGGTYRVTLL